MKHVIYTEEEIQAREQFHLGLKVGDAVEVRWTSCGRAYRANATVAKVNDKSIRCALDQDVPCEGGAYEKGREVVVPSYFAPTFSVNNGVAPRTSCGMPVMTPEEAERYIMSTDPLGRDLVAMSVDQYRACVVMLAKEPLKELRRRQDLIRAQQRLAFEQWQEGGPDTKARMEEASGNLQVMEAYTSDAVMYREFFKPKGEEPTLAFLHMLTRLQRERQARATPARA